MKRLLILILVLSLTVCTAMAETVAEQILTDVTGSVSLVLPDGYRLITPEMKDVLFSQESIDAAIEEGVNPDVASLIDPEIMAGAMVVDGSGLLYLFCQPAAGATNRILPLVKDTLDDTMSSGYESMGYSVLGSDLVTVGDLYWYVMTLSVADISSTLCMTYTNGYTVSISFTGIPEEDILTILPTLQIL